MRIGVRELRQHASRVLSIVKSGESVEVTERGVLVAVLVPPEKARSERDRLVADGRLRPASSPTGRLASPTPVELPEGGPSSDQLLEQERAERL